MSSNIEHDWSNGVFDLDNFPTYGFTSYEEAARVLFPEYYYNPSTLTPQFPTINTAPVQDELLPMHFYSRGVNQDSRTFSSFSNIGGFATSSGDAGPAAAAPAGSHVGMSQPHPQTYTCRFPGGYNFKFGLHGDHLTKCGRSFDNDEGLSSHFKKCHGLPASKSAKDKVDCCWERCGREVGVASYLRHVREFHCGISRK